MEILFPNPAGNSKASFLFSSSYRGPLLDKGLPQGLCCPRTSVSRDRKGRGKPMYALTWFKLLDVLLEGCIVLSVAFKLAYIEIFIHCNCYEDKIVKHVF